MGGKRTIDVNAKGASAERVQKARRTFLLGATITTTAAANVGQQAVTIAKTVTDSRFQDPNQADLNIQALSRLHFERFRGQMEKCIVCILHLLLAKRYCFLNLQASLVIMQDNTDVDHHIIL